MALSDSKRLPKQSNFIFFNVLVFLNVLFQWKWITILTLLFTINSHTQKKKYFLANMSYIKKLHTVILIDPTNLYLLRLINLFKTILFLSFKTQ